MWDVATNEKQKKTHPERSRAAKINHKLDNRKFNTHPQTCWHTHIHKEHKQKLKSKKSVSLPQSCTVYWVCDRIWNKINKVKTFTVILAQTKQPEVTLAICETYPFPHKSACCQSFIPARQVCSSDFFRLKMEAETLQTPFLCSEFLLLAGPVLLLSYWLLHELLTWQHW